MDARVKRALATAEKGKINVKLWALVIATIEANSKKYNQDSLGWKRPTCGTPACQAGWTQFLVDGEITRKTWDVAQKALNLPIGEPFWETFGERYAENGHYLGPATARTIRASVNEWLATQGYKPLAKVKPVGLRLPN